MYIISNDSPDEQLQLYNAIKEAFGDSLPFVSDPNLEVAERFGMKNGDVASRGYAMLDKEGSVVFSTVNDHWGEQFDQTVEEIKEKYKQLKN